MRPVKTNRSASHDAAGIAKPDPSPPRPDDDDSGILPLLLVVSDRPALFR